MTDLDVDALLAPLGDEKPCGDDLEYDPAFMALDAASRGKAEQQFGETLIAAQEPNWREMERQALELLQRTRDLRVAMQLLRATTRLQGLAGFAPSIRLLHGLVERHWEHVHPQLDASDGNDPTMRLNALRPLIDPLTVLADIRAASLSAERGLTAHQIEVALGRGEALPGEANVTEQQIVQAVMAAGTQPDGMADKLIAAHEAVRGIETVVDTRVGAAGGLDLKSLRSLTQCLANVAQQAKAAAAPAAMGVGDAAAGAGSSTATAGIAVDVIRTREDTIRALDRVCEWIDRNEPTNPAPLLIRRAQRLMGKSFIDIIRDLAPDGLKDVERLAGVGSE